MRPFLVGLALVLLCGVAAAADAKITLDVKDKPLRAVARDIAKQSKLAVIVGPLRADARITLTLEGVPVKQALARVASAARAQVVKLTSKAVWIGRNLEVWEKRLHASLVLTRLKVDFKDRHIVKALRFVAGEMGTTIALDPEVSRTRKRNTLMLTLKAADIPSRDLFDRVAASLDLAWDVRYGVVFLSTKERLASLPRYGTKPPPAGRMTDAESKLRRRMAVQTVYHDFNGTSAAKALRYLSKTLSVPLVIAADVEKGLEDSSTVIQKFEGINFQQMLDLVLVPRGFGYQPTAKGVKILRKN